MLLLSYVPSLRVLLFPPPRGYWQSPHPPILVLRITQILRLFSQELSQLANSFTLVSQWGQTQEKIHLPWKWNLERMRAWQIECVYIFHLERTQRDENIRYTACFHFHTGIQLNRSGPACKNLCAGLPEELAHWFSYAYKWWLCGEFSLITLLIAVGYPVWHSGLSSRQNVHTTVSRIHLCWAVWLPSLVHFGTSGTSKWCHCIGFCFLTACKIVFRNG